MILVTKWFGTFLCEEGRVIRKTLFPQDAEAIAERLSQIQRGGVLPEERALAEDFKVKVSESRQSPIGKPVFFDSSFISPEDYGYSKELMHDVMLRLARLRTSEPIPRDRNIVQAIRSLDDLIETANLMNERLHEWYGLHFPELADHARDRRYAELIAEHGEREGIIEALELGLESMGADMDAEDMEAIQRLASSLVVIYDEKGRTEDYIEDSVQGAAPCLCALLGSALAARVISLAGGLDRLSRLPASTVQMLGAEKAMFRHLRSHKKPPKHGVIFQHPLVHRSPYWQRGKIARSLAAKAAIASRMDRYGEGGDCEALVGSFEKRVEEIRKKYPQAPPRPTRGKRPRKRNR